MLYGCAKRCQTKSLHRFTNMCPDPERCQNILSPRTNLAQTGLDRPLFFTNLLIFSAILTVETHIELKEKAPSQSTRRLHELYYYSILKLCLIVFIRGVSNKKTLQDPNQMISWKSTVHMDCKSVPHLCRHRGAAGTGRVTGSPWLSS